MTGSYFLCRLVPPCRWKVDSQEIYAQSDPNYRLLEGNLLISDPHAVDHSGVYQCIASNSLGTVVSREARVQFACKPVSQTLVSTNMSQRRLQGGAV